MSFLGSQNVLTVQYTNSLNTDTINEFTQDNGVDVEGVHLEDSAISSTTNITASGTITAATIDASTSVTTDTINETTGGAGVTVEGIKFEDSEMNCTQFTGATMAFGKAGNSTSTVTQHRSNSNVAGNAPSYIMQRSRTSASAVADGDNLGAYTFEGHDGTAFSAVAEMRAIINDTVATDELATDVYLRARPPGSTTLSNDNLIIHHGGGIVVENRSANPVGATNGLIYYNTTQNELRAYINGAWRSLDNSAA